MTVVWLGVKFYKPIKVTVGGCSAPRGSTGGPLPLIILVLGALQHGVYLQRQIRFRQFLKDTVKGLSEMGRSTERFACDGDGGGEAAVCCWRTVASI